MDGNDRSLDGLSASLDLVLTGGSVEAYASLTGVQPKASGLVQPEFLLAAMPSAFREGDVDNVSYGYDSVRVSGQAKVGERLSLNSRTLHSDGHKVFVEERCTNAKGAEVITAIHVFLYL